MEKTIPGLVRGAAERFGDQTAIEEGATRLSFRALAQSSLQAARAFMAAMSFDPETHWTHPTRPFADFRVGEVFRELTAGGELSANEAAARAIERIMGEVSGTK